MVVANHLTIRVLAGKSLLLTPAIAVLKDAFGMMKMVVVSVFQAKLMTCF
jgi:hypothetical protein